MDRLLAMAKFETFAQYEAEVFAIQASADLKWFHAALELLRAESPENRRTAIDVLGQFRRVGAKRRWAILQHQLISERDPGVVAAIVSNLKFSAPNAEAHAELLSTLLPSPHPEVLAEVMKEFPRELASTAASQALDLSSHDEEEVAYWACDLLADAAAGDSEQIRWALVRRIERNPKCEQAYLGLAVRRDTRVIPLLVERIQNHALSHSILGCVEVWPQEQYVQALQSQVEWLQGLVACAQSCIELCQKGSDFLNPGTSSSCASPGPSPGSMPPPETPPPGPSSGSR